jgi:CRISPR system Cascade subunit CasD
MSETASLAILIDAPLQAWGASSRFQRRETEAFPVKSALVGLLAAALRIDKHDEAEADRLAPLAALRVTVYRLPKAKGRDARHRELPVQRLVDFHTVGGGYDKSASPMEKLSIPRKASGPPFGTVITRRTYLTDARFAAVLTGDAATIETAADGLADPAWGVWFGRKACLPALPLAPTVAPTAGEALARLLALLSEWEEREAPDPATLDCWEEPEASDPGEGDFFLHDTPLSFKDRAFAARPVRHRRATKPVPGRFDGSLEITDAFFQALPEADLAAGERGEPDDHAG